MAHTGHRNKSTILLILIRQISQIPNQCLWACVNIDRHFVVIIGTTRLIIHVYDMLIVPMRFSWTNITYDWLDNRWRRHATFWEQPHMIQLK